MIRLYKGCQEGGGEGGGGRGRGGGGFTKDIKKKGRLEQNYNSQPKSVV